MNEADFLEEHPSFVQDIIYPFQNGKGFIDLKAIHETQLDKAKVLEDITELQEHKHIEEARNEYKAKLVRDNVPHEDFNAYDFLVGWHTALKKLKKELRLE